MRKVVVTAIVSLDGYYEGPGGNVMLLPMDHAFDAYNVQRLRTAGTLLLGATTYRMFKGFWPAVADSPEAGATHRELAQRENAMAKVVVSDTLRESETDPWRGTTRIVRRADARARVAELRDGDEGDGDILVFGSRTLWHDLLAAGLVDEIHLVVGAVVLGAGTPAFPAPAGPAGTPLRRLDVTALDGSDNLLARYAPVAV